MVMRLGSLAHNVLVWMRRWLSVAAPKLSKLGLLRLVRDVLRVSVFVELGKADTIIRVVLNRSAVLAYSCVKAYRALLRPQRISVCVGDT